MHIAWLVISKLILQKAFGNHVKKLREQKGFTQVDVSSRMGKDQQSLQRVESGNVSPNLYYLYNLCVGLEVTLDELLRFEIPRKKK